MRKLVGALLGIGLVLAGALSAPRIPEARQYPTKNVRLLIPYGAGSATPTSPPAFSPTRCAPNGATASSSKTSLEPSAFSPSRRWPAASRTATRCGNVSTNAITPVVCKAKMKIDYDKDVVTVTKVYRPVLVLGDAGRRLPPKTMKEFVAYAKANAGGSCATRCRASRATRTTDQEALQMKEGFEAQHVSAKSGGAGMLQDILSGDVHRLRQCRDRDGSLKSGQVRALRLQGPDAASASTRRADDGRGRICGLRLVELGERVGAGRHAEGDARLHPQVVRGGGAVSQVKEAFAKQQVYVDVSPSLEAAKAFHDAEVGRWKEVIAKSKINPE